MNKKIGLVIASTLFLIVFLSTPLAFTQPWTSVDLNLQTMDYSADTTGFSCWIIAPVSPTSNTIDVSGTAGSYTWTVYPGDHVVLSLTGFNPENVEYSAASGHISYSGPADSVTINAVEIPEFPSFLIIPVFITATLLAAIVLRRKLTS